MARGMLTVLYICGVVLAMNSIKTIQLIPSTQSVQSGTSFAVHTDHQDEDLIYAWAIDGVLLSGISTSSLAVEWDVYATIFPHDMDGDSTRTITVATMDDDGQLYAGEGMLVVDHSILSCVSPGICGDGNVDMWEECDDMNTIDSDGCSSTCLCEWVCISLIIQDSWNTCEEGE